MAAKSERDLVYERRRLLENPYAHIEQLEFDAHASSVQRAATHDEIAAARKLSENPYAYLSDAGTFEALGPSRGAELQPVYSSSRSGRAWSDREIEAKVREMHAAIWHKRAELWGETVPNDPIDLLDPSIALQLLGYDFRYEDGLGQMRGRTGRIEVGGLIDNSAKLVRVARQFSPAVRSFTAAHELGHAALHQHLAVLHQDKPLDGLGAFRDRVEIEANKFATLFLMPARLVAARFAELFTVRRFDLTDDLAFALVGKSLPELRGMATSRRDLARLLAGAERFNGRHFQPIHAQFRVSREAMAIRLEELAIVPG